jgi:xanthine dehydrogenase accessory factor
VVVLSTRGSTYRKRGAFVLLDASGVRAGALSGGCLEPELERRAREVVRSGRAEGLTFDTEPAADRVFGSGLGCRGVVDGLLLPIPARSPASPLAALERALEERTDLSLTFDLGPSAFGSGEARAGGWTMAWNAGGLPASSPSGARDASLDVPSPPRLLLLGAGPETAPLLAFTRRLGWFATVVDHRRRWADPAREAGADDVLELAPEAARAALEGRRFEAAVVMSHGYEVDLAHLRAWAGSGLGFIGLVGPAARREALLAGARRGARRPGGEAPLAGGPSARGRRAGGDRAEPRRPAAGHVLGAPWGLRAAAPCRTASCSWPPERRAGWAGPSSS